MTRYIPRHEESGVNFTISTDFSGSSGDSNRVYTLSYSGAILAGMNVVVSGSALQNTTDYTFDSGANTITFLSAIFDSMKVSFDYNTEYAGSSGTDTAYATTEQLAKFMQIYGQTIDKPNSTFLEEVGTGTGSQTTFMLDYSGIIASSYTFYYGATAEAALSNSLTETTHYTIDKDKGIVTLTSAGVTLVSTNKIYGDYAFNTLGILESEMQNALNRAASWIDSETGAHFADGTETTPDWNAVSNEKHKGKGPSDRDYYTWKYPLADVSTLLNGDHAVGATTLTVDSTQGFPSSGTLAIGSEKITYSAKSTTSFTCTATTAAHSDDDTITSHVVEMSATDEGTSPTWTVLESDVDYDLDTDAGRVHISRDDIILGTANVSYPPRHTPNRVRISYLHGYDTIPEDITKLTLMIASQDLMHAAVRKATVNGMDNFTPAMVDVDNKMIESIIGEYKSRKSSNI